MAANAGSHPSNLIRIGYTDTAEARDGVCRHRGFIWCVVPARVVLAGKNFLIYLYIYIYIYIIRILRRMHGRHSEARGARATVDGCYLTWAACS